MIRLRTLGGVDLTNDDGRELRAVLRQPKRLALLSYLATATPHGFQRRDTLVALFWPEQDQPHARGALRQAVRFLRRQLGDGAVVARGEEEIALGDPVWCDAVAFEQAAAEERAEEALETYRGDFLAGLFVSDAAPELDHWIETQRTRFRLLAARAAWLAAGSEERQGNPRGAAYWARRAMAFAGHDESALRQLISLLDRLGDRAGAIQVYEEFARDLAKEYQAAPSAETRALVEILRSRATVAPVVAPAVAPATPPPQPPEPLQPPAVVVHPPSRGRVPLGAVLLAGAVAIGGAVTALARGGEDPPPVFAVGDMRDHTGSDSALATAVLADLLATNLSRLPGLAVLSTSRLYEVVGQLRVLGDTANAIPRAAHRAGATHLIRGSLYRDPDGTFRLDLERLDLGNGHTRHAARPVRAGDWFTLVDSATSDLARAMGLRAPALGVSNVTTSSLRAHALYEEALRAYQTDTRSALGLFQAALTADSTFAMAAYYVARCHLAVGDQGAARAPLIRAARLAQRSIERERLLIRATLAYIANDPAFHALAESLATRHPAEPDAHLLLAQARHAAGDFLGSLHPSRLVVEVDSLAFRGGVVHCRACDALNQIAGAYMMMDSLAAADRVTRDGLRLLLGAPMWSQGLAVILSRQGRGDEALAAFRPGPIDSSTFRATNAIRVGAFSQGDSILHQEIGNGTGDLEGLSLWFLSISLRNQGRLEEALAVARRLRRLRERASPRIPGESVVEAQVLFEMGRTLQAAALFDSLARGMADPDFPARAARDRTWQLTHVATALDAAGDTAAVAALVDRIEAEGTKSLYGRDPRLHHHARGLLWRARGRPADAVLTFRRALYSVTMGYTRTNLELGRTLLELDRPREAVAVVAPALRGPLDASNLYVTHTELHELLAQAYEAAGQRDSALIHYRWVLNAWRGADPKFRERVAAVRERVSALQSTAH